jgi:hypothetical protein
LWLVWLRFQRLRISAWRSHLAVAGARMHYNESHRAHRCSKEQDYEPPLFSQFHVRDERGKRI